MKISVIILNNTFQKQSKINQRYDLINNNFTNCQEDSMKIKSEFRQSRSNSYQLQANQRKMSLKTLIQEKNIIQLNSPRRSRIFNRKYSFQTNPTLFTPQKQLDTCQNCPQLMTAGSKERRKSQKIIKHSRPYQQLSNIINILTPQQKRRYYDQKNQEQMDKNTKNTQADFKTLIFQENSNFKSITKPENIQKTSKVQNKTNILNGYILIIVALILILRHFVF